MVLDKENIMPTRWVIANGTALSFAMFLIVQAFLATIWGARLDQRVTELAKDHEELEKHVEILDSVGGRKVHEITARIDSLEKIIPNQLTLIFSRLQILPVLEERSKTTQNQIESLSSHLNEIIKDNQQKYKLQDDIKK